MVLAIAIFGLLVAAPDSERVLVEGMIHLRQLQEREWSSFPRDADARALEHRFHVEEPRAFSVIRWHQEDVRQRWSVHLNGTEVARLADDEALMTVFADLPTGVLRAGENTLRIETSAEDPDDILVGHVALVPERSASIRTQARITATITDAGGRQQPGRITVIDSRGALVPLDLGEADDVAARTGVVYTASGHVDLRLPAGFYRIYASRGSAFEADSLVVSLERGDRARLNFEIERSVRPADHYSVDTHVHTLEWSGHGDATVSERVITALGEGLDAVILTEHNRHASLRAAADRLRASGITLIAGNEYTTPLGHFNAFPVDVTADAPDPQIDSWGDVAARLGDAPAVVLNHGRDVHADFVPLGPDRFLQPSGERLDGAELPANSMEIWNSSAQRSDPFELFTDWLSIANRGTVLTPIGSSDSHDVSRYILGQGRTYVRCPSCTGESDVSGTLVSALVAGQVAPSMGLVVEIEVDERPASGDLVEGQDSVRVVARVWGPGWMKARNVSLFVNGMLEDSRQIDSVEAAGVKAEVSWRLPGSDVDRSVAVLASGPAPDVPFWRIPKPYQRTSEAVTQVVAGASGLARLDGDGDGQWTSPFDYARQVVESSEGDLQQLFDRLADHHPAVGVQAASILRARGVKLPDDWSETVARALDPRIIREIQRYEQAARAGAAPETNVSTDR